MYAATTGASQCILCEENHYQSEVGQSTCLRCEIGKKTEVGQKGATACQTCGAGEYGESCSACAVGMFRPGSDEDATVCFDCPAGFHQDQEAGAACLPCIP